MGKFSTAAIAKETSNEIRNVQNLICRHERTVSIIASESTPDIVTLSCMGKQIASEQIVSEEDIDEEDDDDKDEEDALITEKRPSPNIFHINMQCAKRPNSLKRII